MSSKKHARIAVLVAVAIVLSGCTADSGYAEPAASPHLAAASGADVDAFIERLGTIGVPTYADDAALPLAPVSEPESGMIVAERDAAVLAVGAADGIGITGAQLDQLVVPSPLVEGAEPLPPSLWLVGWAQAAGTPAADFAKELLGDQDWSEWEQVVFPTAVLVLFAADATTLSRGIDGGHSTPGASGPGIGLASSRSSICTDALAFVDGMIDRFFGAIGRVALVGYSGDVIGDIVVFIRNLGARVVNFALDSVQALIKNGVRVLLAPVLFVIAKIATVAAIAATVTNSIRPWEASFTREPLTAERGIEPVPGSMTLTISTVGPNEWPRHVEGCARAAGITLPSLKPTGADVQWTIQLEDPDPSIRRTIEDGRLNSEGSATWEYHTLPESPEVAAGELKTDGVILLRVEVRRDDLTELQAFITDQILSLMPPGAREITNPILRPVLDEQLEYLRGSLKNLHDLAARAKLPLTYHDAEDEEPPKLPDASRPTKPFIGAVPDGCPQLGLVFQHSEASTCFYAPQPGTDYAFVITLDAGNWEESQLDGAEPTSLPGAERASQGCTHVCGVTALARGRVLIVDGATSISQARAYAMAVLGVPRELRDDAP